MLPGTVRLETNSLIYKIGAVRHFNTMSVDKLIDRYRLGLQDGNADDLHS